MIHSADEFVRLRMSEEKEDYDRAAHDSASEEVWRSVISDYPDMKRWVAHNKTVPLSVLGILIDDPDPSVRFAVAQKRKLSAEMFEVLADDPAEGVRHGIAVNQKTPIEVLRKLCHDDSHLVAEAARRRLRPLE